VVPHLLPYPGKAADVGGLPIAGVSIGMGAFGAEDRSHVLGTLFPRSRTLDRRSTIVLRCSRLSQQNQTADSVRSSGRGGNSPAFTLRRLGTEGRSRSFGRDI
jgi:hypothetical protein